MERMVLPQRRPSITFNMTYGLQNTAYGITVGYPSLNNKIVREVFINGARTGTDMDAITRDAAILLSLALQHGVDLGIIAKAMTRDGDNENNKASSIIGAIVDRIIANEEA